MKLDIREQDVSDLEHYSSIPIAFKVSNVFDIEEESNIGAATLKERTLARSYVKDYDAICGEHPTDWPSRFDASNWKMFTAYLNGQLVGGAVVAMKTPSLNMLGGRNDVALIWDIRVAPESRGHGVGTSLFRAAEAWSRSQGCRQLKVETQNINVPACRFYERQGCILITVDRHAYRNLPDEIQLLWQKNLAKATGQ
ncbi:MAG TPA: GNAT family N-acetyltransferase [Pyrinomonadaceae bacterium]|nr:GNAT family N-acetyltransferase [Pyrinomonadaceae bacterium]